MPKNQPILRYFFVCKNDNLYETVNRRNVKGNILIKSILSKNFQDF